MLVGASFLRAKAGSGSWFQPIALPWFLVWGRLAIGMIIESTLGYACGDSVAPLISLSPANFLPQQIYGFGKVARLYGLSLTSDSRPSFYVPALKVGKLNSCDDFASNYFYCSYMSLAFCGQVNGPLFSSRAPFAPVNNYGAVAGWTAKN